MPDKFESFKDELKQLGLFLVRLIVHCLVLLAILLFILVITWIHRWFRRSYSEIEMQGSSVHRIMGPEVGIRPRLTE